MKTVNNFTVRKDNFIQNEDKELEETYRRSQIRDGYLSYDEVIPI